MRTLIFFLTSLFLISIGVLIVIIFNTSPISSGNIVIFGAILFMFLTILAAVSLWAILYERYIIKRQHDMQIAATLRRSSFFSLLLIGLISLKILGVLSVLSGLSFGLAIILIEIFFSLRKKEIEL